MLKQFLLLRLSEAVQRLLIEKFVEEEHVEVSNPVTLVNLVQNCIRDNLNVAIQDPSTQIMMEKYINYEVV